jgi:dTDP-4-amino-4,6-dideoxygalactose transaminase
LKNLLDKEKLKELPISFQKMNINLRSSYHLFVVKLLNKKNIENYNKIFNFLRKNNIHINLHYIPIHTQPFYKKFGFKKGNFLNAEKYSKSALSIPIYYGLKKKDQLMIIKTLKKALIKYS